MEYLIAIIGIAVLGGIWIGIERLTGNMGRESGSARCAGCGQGCQDARRE